MAGLPEGIPKDSRRRLPPRTIRSAALAALAPGAIVTIAFLSGSADGVAEVPAWGAVAVGAAVSGGTYVFILFALFLIRAGKDWNKRGGRPDPFTRY